MAVIKYPLEKDQHPGLTEKCTVCRTRRSDSYWFSSEGTIEVCSSCAVDTLPLVIADAVHDSALGSTAAVEAVARRMEGAFWRGIALRMIREESMRRKEREEIARRAGSSDDE